MLRYQARISVQDIGLVEPFTCWHTDSYELRAGGWQAVVAGHRDPPGRLSRLRALCGSLAL